MSKKNIIRFLSCVAMIAVLFTFATGLGASACSWSSYSCTQTVSVAPSNYALAQVIIDKANSDIVKAVNETKLVCDLLVFIGFDSSDPIIQYLIDNLVDKTNKIAAKAIADCKALGVIAVCEYEEYIIGGNVVLIDPIKTIPV